MTGAPVSSLGLGARLLAAIMTVILIASATAWAVASLLGPRVFHRHMVQTTADSGAIHHAERAFSDSSTISLGIALLAGLVTSLVVSGFLTGRISSALHRVQNATRQVASGDYSARVPVVGMGAEFDELARDFNTMAEDLARIETTRVQMLSDLAHEMRTPVATLDAYTQAITEGVQVADGDTVQILRDQIHRLGRLAADISLVTAAEEGRLGLHRRPLEMGDVISTAVSQAEDRFASKGVSLTLDAEPSALAARVNGDSDRLGQTLTNLLDNALRHTPRQGSVRVSLTQVDTAVRFEISDTGEGIAAEHLPHLFERFYRVDTARDRPHGGSGIGLAIVRSIVQHHGGTVEVLSAGPGAGSTFTITLPIVT